MKEMSNEKDICLWLGDCLVEMDKIEDDSVDLILADLPYGTTACRWDTIIPFDLLWKQYLRISKKTTPIVLFGSEPFSSLLRTSNLKMFRYDIIWNKKKPSNFQMMNFQPGRIHEVVSVFSKSPAVYCNNNHMNYYPVKTNIEPYTRKRSFYGSKNSTLREGHTIKELGEKTRTTKHPVSIIEYSNANIKEKRHPTEKPVSVLEYLIMTFSKEENIILDNTMGVGSTGVAAKQLNRKFIGIEKEQKYYDLAVNRIMNETVWGSSLVDKEVI